jgi:hypothetical protein
MVSRIRAFKEATAEYHRRDYRIKCSGCGSWMRRTPTVNTRSMRRPPPHASRCTNCPPRKLTVKMAPVPATDHEALEDESLFAWPYGPD